MVSDYERIARVIRYLDESHIEQPTLTQIARVAGLSPAHFHRMFVRWTGATPKDFIQCLTLNHAKARLEKGASILEAALDSGLSGSSRLHDLCVKLESATPGEIKHGGRDLNVSYGLVESPFGQVFIAETSRGISHISFPDHDSKTCVRQLQIAWPKAIIKVNYRRAKQIAAQIFHNPTHPHVPEINQNQQNVLQLYLRGTPFQIHVWRALIEIPEGSLTSYGALAKLIGKPNASRAVGTAVGANPLAYLIPCHRVIRETGIIGQYRWGATRKKVMLLRENIITNEK